MGGHRNMNQPFIIYRPYKDLSWVESMLISWIISLNDAKQAVCFSNEYASKMLKVSIPTITRSVAHLKLLGFINTFQPLGDKRFIHLLNKPEVEDISFQSCDLEGVVIMTIPPNHNDYPPNQDDYTPSSQGLEPLITTITNNIEYKKDNNISTPYEADTRFNKIVGLFPKTKQKGMDEAFNYVWLFLKEDDKKQIEKILPVYLQRNNDEPKFIKPVNKYFNERFWITDDISLSLLKGNNTKQKQKPQIIL
jgi:hypothetical protein